MTYIGQFLRMSNGEFTMLGVGQIAYVKPVSTDGIRIYEICAADGTPISLAPSRELAAAAVRQHGLAPVSVN